MIGISRLLLLSLAILALAQPTAAGTWDERHRQAELAGGA